MPPTALPTGYAPRPIRPLDTWLLDGWTLKVYGITHGPAPIAPALLEAARSLAARTLPQPAVAADRYGLGFVGIHQGNGADFVFVDWWGNDNEIHHVNYCAGSGDVARLEEVRGAVICVWDLRVLEFERRAWIETMLANPAGPDRDAYLAHRLSEDV